MWLQIKLLRQNSSSRYKSLIKSTLILSRWLDVNCMIVNQMTQADLSHGLIVPTIQTSSAICNGLTCSWWPFGTTLWFGILNCKLWELCDFESNDSSAIVIAELLDQNMYLHILDCESSECALWLLDQRFELFILICESSDCYISILYFVLQSVNHVIVRFDC